MCIRDRIKAGEGLFYSYNVGIGSNFLALYVYYLARPFNWLVFLLPEGLIMEFMSYLVILRIGLMAVSYTHLFWLSIPCSPSVVDSVS